MRQETFTLSQKELQRVSVISTCIKGDLACASAAELLSLSVRQIKRLKKRLREDGEAALAHANRGRPSPRRLPERIRQAVVRLARSKYAGFNDHHLCEKLNEVEGLHCSRETLRRLLRKEGLGSPRKRRAPAHRQRRVRVAREGELVQLDGSPHDWLEGRGPRLTALGMQDDASGKILAAQFFPAETTEGYFSPAAEPATPLRHTYGVSAAIAAVSSSATTTARRCKKQKFSSTRRSTARSRCTTAMPASSTPHSQGVTDSCCS
jgi:transposase